MALSEGLVYGGKEGTGASKVIKTDGINPAKLYLANIEEEKQKRAAEDKARAEANAKFAKELSDFNPKRWYKYDSDISNGVQGVRDYALENYKKGINVFDPKNLNEYTEYQNKKADVEKLASYTTQLQPEYGKRMDFIAKNGEENINPESISALNEWTKLSPKEAIDTPMPQLSLIPEKTDWLSKFRSENTVISDKDVRTGDKYKKVKILANSIKNRANAKNWFDTRSDDVKQQIFRDLNTTNLEKVYDYLQIDADNRVKETNELSKLASGNKYMWGTGQTSEDNPLGLGADLSNYGNGEVTGYNTFAIPDKSLKRQSGIDVNSKEIIFTETGEKKLDNKNNFTLKPEHVITYNYALKDFKMIGEDGQEVIVKAGDIVPDGTMEESDFAKIRPRTYVRGNATFIKEVPKYRKDESGFGLKEDGTKQEEETKTVLVPLEFQAKEKMFSDTEGLEDFVNKINNSPFYKQTQGYSNNNQSPAEVTWQGLGE